MRQTKIALHGRELEDEFCSIALSLGGDIPSRIAGDSIIKHSPIARHGKSEPWSMAPKIFDARGWEQLKEITETMHGIMASTLAYLSHNPARLDAYHLPQPVRKQLLSTAPDALMPPLVRVDIFFNEETGEFQLCETNADGSAGFAANDFVTQAITSSKTYELFKQAHPSVEPVYLSRHWVEAALDHYNAWASSHPCANNEQGNPVTIALIDYRESIEWGEALYFIDLFKQQGIEARFADVRDLHLENINGHPTLYDKLGAIDIAWKRVVTGELFEKPCNGASALIKAIEQDATCALGNLASWPIATKTFFAMLHADDASNYLTQAQLDFVKQHVPETYILDDKSDPSRFSQRELWIAKPAAGYNAVDVTAGADVDAAQWEATLKHHAKAHGVIQRYAKQYATPVIPGHSEGCNPRDFPSLNNMLGLFLFNGTFSGVFSRCGKGKVIGEAQGRLEQGVILVK